MSSYSEVNAQALGHFHEPTPAAIRRAGVATASWGLANGLDHAAIAELLQMVGVAPSPEPGGKTSPVGRHITPEVLAQRRQAKADRRAAKRRERNRQDAPKETT